MITLGVCNRILVVTLVAVVHGMSGADGVGRLMSQPRANGDKEVTVPQTVLLRMSWVVVTSCHTPLV